MCEIIAISKITYNWLTVAYHPEQSAKFPGNRYDTPWDETPIFVQPRAIQSYFAFNRESCRARECRSSIYLCRVAYTSRSGQETNRHFDGIWIRAITESYVV